MTDGEALRRLGAFLHVLAAGMFLATIAELTAAEHYGSTLQLVPDALCGLGLLALVALRVRPTRSVVLVIRVAMLVIAAGSVLGVYEHVVGNLDFVHEVRRNADTMTVVKETLRGGDPILAPGVLTIGAAVALAATFARSRRPVARSAPDQRRRANSSVETSSWAAFDH